MMIARGKAKKEGKKGGEEKKKKGQEEMEGAEERERGAQSRPGQSAPSRPRTGLPESKSDACVNSRHDCASSRQSLKCRCDFGRSTNRPRC